MKTSKKIVILVVLGLLVLPLNAMGASDEASSRGPGPRAIDWIQVHGAIRDGANQPPPKAFIVAANGTTMGYVNSSVTFNGDYTFGVPSNDTYLIFMVPFSGQFVDGWEVHGFFPKAKFLTVNDTDYQYDMTIVPALELILNGTDDTPKQVDSGNFTNTKWSTKMDEAAAFAVWSEVDNGTGFKLPSALIPLSETRDLWFQWEVPGYGRAVVKIDNEGSGFRSAVQGGELVDVNYHLARTQLARMQDTFTERFQAGYNFSDGTSKYMQNAAGACEEAGTSTGNARIKHLDRCTANSILALESMELDRAQRDIETFRKGDVEVNIVDANGLPIEGATMIYNQTSHDFLFGVFDNLQEAGIERFRKVRDIGVNFATSGFYWHVTEPTEDNFIFDLINASWGIPELTDMGFTLKAHALIYMNDIVAPDYMKAKNFTEYKSKVYDHVYTLVDTYKDYINIWNVVNEAHGIGASGGFTRAQVTDIIKTGVQAIRAADPDGEILVNNANDWFGQAGALGFYVEDFDNFSLPVHEYLDLLETEGLDYDIVGQQMYNGGFSAFFEKHGLGQDMPVSTFDLGFLSHIFDELDRYNKPIHMTELSVSGSWNESWKDAGYWHSKWNETVQAEFLRQFYTIGFSKEKVQALTWWDLDDNTTFLVGGGLFDENMTPKESFYAMADLISNWTTNSNASTNSTGSAAFRGFAGDYNMTVKWKNLTKDVQFHVNEMNKTVIDIVFENNTLKPDLSVPPWEVQTSLENFVGKGEVNINASVYNEGERSVTNITVRFAHGVPGNWTPIGNDTMIPLLEKGENVAVGTVWTPTDLFGNRTVRIMADPDGNITELNETNNNVSVSLVLPLPEWGWLEGQVVDNETLVPVSEANVDILFSNGTRFARVISDMGGNFSYDKIPTGCYWILTDKKGYVSTNESACVDPVETAIVQVRLVRITWGNIIGSVLDNATNEGIEGATVILLGEDLVQFTNLGGGFAFFDLPEGNYSLEASVASYLPSNGTVTVLANSTSTFDFHLDLNSGDVEGNVTDSQTEAPIAKATLLIPNVMGQITNEVGHFSMLKVPVGTHDIEVGAEGYESTTVTVVITSGNTTFIDITLDPIIAPPDVNGSISGHVLDKKTGKPIPRAIVKIKELDRMRLTDNQGWFEFLKIEPDTYTVEVVASGYKPTNKTIVIEDQENEVLTFDLKKKAVDRTEDVLGATLALFIFLIVLAIFIILLYMRVKKGRGKSGKKDEGLYDEDDEGGAEEE